MTKKLPYGEEQILKDVDDSDLGLKGSPTKIAKASDKVRKGAGEKVVLDPDESVAISDRQVQREAHYLTNIRKSGE